MSAGAAVTAANPPKWFNSPISFCEGLPSEVRQLIPSFDRRRFALTQPDDRSSRLNENFDAIIRRPTYGDQTFVPVGVVSREYALLPHIAVLDMAVKALDKSRIPEKAVKAQLSLSEYGERMHLSLFLPEKYQFDPGDGHPMALRLECVNSVDGSTRFRVLMGWYRFVCSNGLVIGVTRFELRRRHVGEFSLSDVGKVLASGLEQAEIEKGNFEKWRETSIQRDRFAGWIDKHVLHSWGFKAAARAFQIAVSGFDAEVRGQYKDQRPTTIEMERTKRIPGTPLECTNLFDLSQILAWLAKERRDIQEQIEWREQIPLLLSAYMRRHRAATALPSVPASPE